MALGSKRAQDNKTILPGATIGILGGGQLGRMLAQAGISLGYHVIIYTDEAQSPASEVATDSIVASYDDFEMLEKFADRINVVTVEFENIPASSLTFLEERVRVAPNPFALYTFQNRLREKTFLSQNNIPCAPYQKVGCVKELKEALQIIGLPSILKTGGFGYDGKGQIKVTSEEHADEVLSKPIKEEMVLEGFVDFDFEVSVLIARSIKGEIRTWGLIKNLHTNHILDVSSVPASVSLDIEKQAREIAIRIAESSGAVGVLCVEFFLTRDKKLLVNEIAPRVHNSGHLTIEASYTSQFEQHIRAICGLPLGATEYLKPAAMANLLGELWSKDIPMWDKALSLPKTNLHLYGKEEARPGRKMGHITVLAETCEEARAIVTRARSALVEGV